MDDWMDEQAQPRCRDCSVVMRDHPTGWGCPACGWSILVDEGVVPPVFTGVALRGC